jgi:hypothetical protein
MKPIRLDDLLAQLDGYSKKELIPLSHRWLFENSAAGIRTLIEEREKYEAHLGKDIKDVIGENAALREFFKRCWRGATEYAGGLDGAELQDWGEELGLLKKVVRNAPCGEDCNCEEYGAEFPTDCYVPSWVVP